MLELNMEALNMSHPSHLGRAYESRVKDLLISCQAADNEFNVNGINIDNVLVTGLSTNSQDVEPGDVFIALNGLNTRGHDFIDRAIDKGAVAIFADTDGIFSLRILRVLFLFLLRQLSTNSPAL